MYALLLLALTTPSPPGLAAAQDQAVVQGVERCVEEVHPFSDFGLPAALIDGDKVTVRRCPSSTLLHAAFRFGNHAAVALAGPVPGSGEDGCLTSSSSPDPDTWPGLQVRAFQMCHEQGRWVLRVDGTVAYGVLGIPFQRAAVEVGAARQPTSLRAPRLKLGPFVIQNAVVTTSVVEGRVVPAHLSGDLLWQDDPAQPSPLSGKLGPGIDIPITFRPPASFPFDGAQLGVQKARLRLMPYDGGEEWRLFVTASAGVVDVGAFGAFLFNTGELEARFRSDTAWAMAGCLAARPAVSPKVHRSRVVEGLGVRWKTAALKACGERWGTRYTVWGAATLPGLGLVDVETTATRTYPAAGTAKNYPAAGTAKNFDGKWKTEITTGPVVVGGHVIRRVMIEEVNGQPLFELWADVGDRWLVLRGVVPASGPFALAVSDHSSGTAIAGSTFERTSTGYRFVVDGVEVVPGH